MNLKAIYLWLKRLNQRLLLSFLLVALVPVSMMGAISLPLHLKLVNHEVEARQTEVTAIVARQITVFIRSLEINLRRIGITWDTLDPAPDAMSKLLHSFMMQNRMYTSMTIIDADGMEVSRVVSGYTIPPDALRDRREEEIFFRAQRGETYYSSVRLNAGEPQITVALPIYDDDDLFTGVITADINLQDAWMVIRDFRIGTDGYAVLVDQRGNIITHRDPSVVASQRNLATTPALNNAMGLAPTISIYQYSSLISNEKVIGTATQIAGPDWFLIIERPTREAFQAERQAQQIAVAVLIAAIIVALILSALISHQITRPIYALREVARQFGRGDLSARSRLSTGDELEELATTFNAMADRLQGRILEINEKNEALSSATAQAQEANRLKDEFLAVMSHELRTPLNAILGFTGILQLKGQLNEQQMKLLDRIEANSERLLNLINDILDISRIQAGRWEVVNTIFAPRKLISQLVGQMRVLADNKNLTLNITIDPTVPENILADEEALTKIITNLTANAIKFTQHGSVSLRLERAADQLKLQVQDTGIGIPAHLHTAIFDQFRQVDGSSTRVYGGTGLGLAIVRRLVDVIGGQVSVESESGAGATFTVLLPCVEPMMEGQPHEA